MSIDKSYKKPLAHSKKRQDPVSMGRDKKIATAAKNTVLPIQFLPLRLPGLQEYTFKAKTLKSPGCEASDVEMNYKFKPSHSQAVETHQTRKEKTVFDKLKLFILKQSIIAFFQYIIMNHQQFLLDIILLIFSLVLVIRNGV